MKQNSFAIYYSNYDLRALVIGSFISYITSGVRLGLTTHAYLFFKFSFWEWVFIPLSCLVHNTKISSIFNFLDKCLDYLFPAFISHTLCTKLSWQHNPCLLPCPHLTKCKGERRDPAVSTMFCYCVASTDDFLELCSYWIHMNLTLRIFSLVNRYLQCLATTLPARGASTLSGGSHSFIVLAVFSGYQIWIPLPVV